MLRGIQLLDKELGAALTGISNADYLTLDDMAKASVHNRHDPLDAWRAMVNNTGIFLNNMAMKGILNLVIKRGTDPIRLSFLEIDIGQRRRAHERMLRELEDDAAESLQDKGRNPGKMRKELRLSPNKHRMSQSSRK